MRDSYYGVGQDPNAYGYTTGLTWISGSQYAVSFDRMLFLPADLTAGVEYRMTGILMDKATGEVFLDFDGKPVTAEAVFVPERDDSEAGDADTGATEPEKGSESTEEGKGPGEPENGLEGERDGIAGIVEDQTLLLAGRQTQAAPDDLLVQRDGFGGSEDGDQIDVRRVKAGGQHRHVNQIAELLGFKGFNQAVALRAGRLAGDERRVAGGQ